jgi:dephospho-CoA kinase
MKCVAVTGGIGSGKTEVCRMLTRRGIPVYDSDHAAKRLYDADDTLLDSIEEAFGIGIRNAGGSLDKEKLASLVFSSPEKLKVLEGIVHPAVMKDFQRWRAMQLSRFEGEGPSAAFFGKEPFSVIESAIILEKPMFLSVVDKVVLVDAPLNIRLSRACKRDGASADKVIARMAVQRFDISRVDAILRNDGALEDLESEVTAVFGALRL